MKRVGFTNEQAGSVEVASSVNGQIMPPVMGAAAFLMVEFIGISYVEVIKHAFIPAVISYIALVYIVHLEALKKGHARVGRGQVLRRDDREILPGLRRGGRGLHRADLRRGRAGGRPCQT